MTVRILLQFSGGIKLSRSTFIKNKYFVAINDSLKSVSYDDHCAVFKRLLDKSLDLLFSNNIDIGSCFIQNYDLVLSQNSSSNANKGFFT